MGKFDVIVIANRGDQNQISSFTYYVHPTNDIQRGYYIDIADRKTLDKFRTDFRIVSPFRHILTTHTRLEFDPGEVNVDLHSQNKELTMIGVEDDEPKNVIAIKNGDKFTMFGNDSRINVRCFNDSELSMERDVPGNILYYLEPAQGGDDGASC